MQDAKIAFIGSGNMGRALIGGLLADGYPAENIRVADASAEQLARVRGQFPVQTSHDNAVTAAGADVLVLAVKPQQLREVAEGLASALAHGGTLVVSVAAGIRTAGLTRWLGEGVPVVRVMPNTPAMVRSGAAAMYATAAVSDAQRELAEAVMRAVGLTVWLDDEAQMDAVTAVSGSGPAYFFLVMEAMENAACALGLPREQARLLTLQTAFGAAKMALESDDDPAALRVQVTSPGGTTERALAVLREHGLEQAFAEALQAARNRSVELARSLGGE